MKTDQNRTTKEIHIRIPQRYREEPILSRLVSDYHLTFNINAAFLGSNAAGDGWFNLSLDGNESDIQAAKAYLQDSYIEIWHKQDW
jgi:hypothetical protein